MNELQRNFRNILFPCIAMFLLLWFCFYTSGVLFVLFIWGSDYVDFNNIRPNLQDFPSSLWPTVFEYLMYLIKGVHVFDLTLKVKLISSVSIPLLAICAALWYQCETLITRQSFKGKESLYGDAQWDDEKTIREAQPMARSRKMQF